MDTGSKPPVVVTSALDHIGFRLFAQTLVELLTPPPEVLKIGAAPGNRKDVLTTQRSVFSLQTYTRRGDRKSDIFVLYLMLILAA